MSNVQSVARANRLVIINDACCLIDLHKVALVTAMLKLPFDFHVPLPVRRNELLSISPLEWTLFEAGGLHTIDLPGDLVARAFALKARHPALSAEDCFSLALVQETPQALLLTGDAALRQVAQEHYSVEVHGILWVADHLVRYGIVDHHTVCTCLTSWDADPLVRLPPASIAARLIEWGQMSA